MRVLLATEVTEVPRFTGHELKSDPEVWTPISHKNLVPSLDAIHTATANKEVYYDKVLQRYIICFFFFSSSSSSSVG